MPIQLFCLIAWYKIKYFTSIGFEMIFQKSDMPIHCKLLQLDYIFLVVAKMYTWFEYS